MELQNLEFSLLGFSLSLPSVYSACPFSFLEVAMYIPCHHTLDIHNLLFDFTGDTMKILP